MSSGLLRRIERNPNENSLSEKIGSGPVRGVNSGPSGLGRRVSEYLDRPVVTFISRRNEGEEIVANPKDTSMGLAVTHSGNSVNFGQRGSPTTYAGKGSLRPTDSR